MQKPQAHYCTSAGCRKRKHIATYLYDYPHMEWFPVCEDVWNASEDKSAFTPIHMKDHILENETMRDVCRMGEVALQINDEGKLRFVAVRLIEIGGGKTVRGDEELATHAQIMEGLTAASLADTSIDAFAKVYPHIRDELMCIMCKNKKH